MNSLSNRIGRIPLTLFALVFAVTFTAGGTVAGVLPMYKQLSGWWKATSYVPVPASVVSVELETRSGRKSQSYRVVAEFSYEYQGQSYLSHRVHFLEGGSDNIGSYQQETYEQLRQARNQLVPVTVWVDPQRPDQAVYDRTIRWLMVVALLPFTLLFPAVGLGAWWVIWRIWRQEGEAPLADAPAASEANTVSVGTLQIRAESGESLSLMAGAVFWNVLCWPLAIVFIADGKAPWWVLAVVAVFPAIGLALVAKAWSTLRARWRIGKPILALSDGGAAGKVPLQGEIMFSPALGSRGDAAEMMHAVTVSVECVRGGRSSANAADAVLWRGEAVQAQVARGTQSLEFQIDLPAPLPAVMPSLKWAVNEHWRVVLETLGGKVRFTVPHAVVGSGALSRPVDPMAAYAKKQANHVSFVLVSAFLGLIFAIPYFASKQNSRPDPQVPQTTDSASPVIEAPFELDSLAGNGFGVVARTTGRMEIRDNSLLLYPHSIELRSFQSCAPACPSIPAVQFMLTKEGSEHFSVLATSASIPVMQHLPDQGSLTVYVPSEKLPLVLNFADRRQLADLRLTLSIEGGETIKGQITDVSWYTHAYPFEAALKAAWN